MASYKYQAPDGALMDKRDWPIGTPVSATLNSGTVVKGLIACRPYLVSGTSWGVRIEGVPYLIALERVDRRYELGLFEIPDKGTSGSEKNTSTHGVGRRTG